GGRMGCEIARSPGRHRAMSFSTTDQSMPRLHDDKAALVSAEHPAGTSGAPGALSPFEAVNYQFDRAARRLELPDFLQVALKTADREVMVELPIRTGRDEFCTFHGYRVQHNNARGPFKGGIRYHPE